MLKRLSSMGFFLMGYFFKNGLGIKRGKNKNRKMMVRSFKVFSGARYKLDANW